MRPIFSEDLKYIKLKSLDETAITTNVYLYKHYEKTKTSRARRHVSRFPTITAWGLDRPVVFVDLKYIKLKSLDETAITTNVYLYKHYEKTKTSRARRHVSRFPTITAWGLAWPVVFVEKD